MAKIDNMMGPNVRLSTNVTTARQTPDTGFGARLHNGLNSAASAVGTGVGAMAGMVPGGQIVSAAVSSMHTFSSTGGSGMGAPYAGVMNTAVGANLSGARPPCRSRAPASPRTQRRRSARPCWSPPPPRCPPPRPNPT